MNRDFGMREQRSTRKVTITNWDFGMRKQSSGMEVTMINDHKLGFWYGEKRSARKVI